MQVVGTYEPVENRCYGLGLATLYQQVTYIQLMFVLGQVCARSVEQDGVSMGLSIRLVESYPAESIMNNIQDSGVYYHYYRLGQVGSAQGQSYCYKIE